MECFLMTGSTHKGCNTGKERIVHLVVQKVHRGVGFRHNQVQKSTSAWKPPTQSNVWCLAQGGWG